MPIYEYNCYDCQERVPLFFRSFAEAETKPAVCPQCGGGRLDKVISNVAMVHTTGTVQVGQASTAAASTSDQSDPKTLARSMQQASQGKDFGGEFREIAKRLESGETPTSIEKSLRQQAGQKPEVH